ETLNENRSIDRTSFTGASLCCVWPEWLFEFSQHGADAYRTGRSVHRRAVPVSLLLGGRCSADRRRSAVACESVRASRAGAARTSNREYHLLSRLPES